MRSQAARHDMSTAELVNVAAGAALAGGEAMLRETGLYQPPTVHLIDEQATPLLLGFVTSRRTTGSTTPPRCGRGWYPQRGHRPRGVRGRRSRRSHTKQKFS